MKDSFIKDLDVYRDHQRVCKVAGISWMASFGFLEQLGEPAFREFFKGQVEKQNLQDAWDSFLDVLSKENGVTISNAAYFSKEDPLVVPFVYPFVARDLEGSIPECERGWVSDPVFLISLLKMGAVKFEDEESTPITFWKAESFIGKALAKCEVNQECISRLYDILKGSVIGSDKGPYSINRDTLQLAAFENLFTAHVQAVLCSYVSRDSLHEIPVTQSHQGLPLKTSSSSSSSNVFSPSKEAHGANERSKEKRVHSTPHLSDPTLIVRHQAPLSHNVPSRTHLTAAEELEALKKRDTFSDIDYMVVLPTHCGTKHFSLGGIEPGVKHLVKTDISDHKVLQVYAYAHNLARIASGSSAIFPQQFLRCEYPARTKSTHQGVPVEMALDGFVLKQKKRRSEVCGKLGEDGEPILTQDLLLERVELIESLKPPEETTPEETTSQAQLSWYCEKMAMYNSVMRSVAEVMVSRVNYDPTSGGVTLQTPTAICRTVTIGSQGKYVYKKFDNSQSRLVNADLWKLYSSELFVGELRTVHDGKQFGLLTAFKQGTKTPTVGQMVKLIDTLIKMANNNHVHLDIRDNNIIFCDDGKEAYFIDFDFGGNLGRCYPPGFKDIGDGGRHPRLRDGGMLNGVLVNSDKVISCLYHDLYALGSVMQGFKLCGDADGQWYQEAVECLLGCESDEAAVAALNNARKALQGHLEDSLEYVSEHRANQKILQNLNPQLMEADSPPRTPEKNATEIGGSN